MVLGCNSGAGTRCRTTDKNGNRGDAVLVGSTYVSSIFEHTKEGGE